MPLKFGQTKVGDVIRNQKVVAHLIQKLISYAPTDRPNCEMIVKVLKVNNVFDTTLVKPMNSQVAAGTVLLDNCRHCRQPVVGIRYKCSVCTDFIICEDCEDIHPESHALLKIKKVADPESDKNGCQHYRRKCQIQVQ